MEKNNNVEKVIEVKKPPKIATYSNLCRSLMILIKKRPTMPSFFFLFELAVEDLYGQISQTNCNCQNSYG